MGSFQTPSVYIYAAMPNGIKQPKHAKLGGHSPRFLYNSHLFPPFTALGRPLNNDSLAPNQSEI
jgi:hypothetical protein